jgi:hypothetical protein
MRHFGIKTILFLPKLLKKSAGTRIAIGDATNIIHNKNHKI